MATTARRAARRAVVENIYITMSDGVQIAAVVHRPPGDGKHPALFAISPYQLEYDGLPAHALFPWRETGPIDCYVGKGYAYIHADVRGSGKSDGAYGYFDRREQEDYCEIIAWIADQDWSNGNVGGIGQSYYAVAQWLMACANPPALKCIVPYDGAIDPYRDQVYHGGIYSEFRYMWFNMLRQNNLLRPANAPTGKMVMPDLGAELLTHQTYDDWWRERTPFERLPQSRVPALSIGVWGKVGLHLRGNLLGYEAIGGPKKLLVMGARNVEEAAHLFDQPDFHERELLPFYDHWLKGEKNGVMDGPPVKLLIRGDDEYRLEKEWPLKRARRTSYYLNRRKSGSVTSLNDGSLTIEEPSKSGGATSYDYPDPEWANGVVARGKFGWDFVGRVLTFTTAPFEKPTEVTGPIVLELFASSDQPDTDFIVKISDQHPQDADARAEGRPPGFTNVTKGWLKASHRKLDAAATTALRPRHTHTDPQPLEPGKIYKFTIEVHPTSYVFPAGHRLRLEIANGDSRLTDAPFTHAYLPYKMGSDTIHHSAKYPSRLILPLIARR
jgi:predicted acyl esterase